MPCLFFELASSCPCCEIISKHICASIFYKKQFRHSANVTFSILSCSGSVLSLILSRFRFQWAVYLLTAIPVRFVFAFTLRHCRQLSSHSIPCVSHAHPLIRQFTVFFITLAPGEKCEGNAFVCVCLSVFLSVCMSVQTCNSKTTFQLT